MYQIIIPTLITAYQHNAIALERRFGQNGVPAYLSGVSVPHLPVAVHDLE